MHLFGISRVAKILVVLAVAMLIAGAVGGTKSDGWKLRDDTKTKS